MKPDIFVSPSFGEMTLEKVIEHIKNYTLEDLKYSYNIVIGTDSQNYQSSTNFVTTIIVHKVGAGGRFFWKKHKENRINILRDRIYKETSFSIDTANKVMSLIKEEDLSQNNLEIHVDVGNKGKTKEFIHEIVGLINGIGYKVKTKPDSFGASTVADRYT